MEYGICNLAVIPLRALADDRSEQVSQVLFGEVFEITEWAERWVKIITYNDNYIGWIGRGQVTMLSHLAFSTFKQSPPSLTYRAVTQAWKIADNSIVYLPAGASLSFLEGTTCKIGTDKFEIIGEIGEKEDIATTAKSFLNAPYLWGGRTHFGIDCSGFTQIVFSLIKIKIKRDASQQAEEGIKVEKLADGRLGDLAFFNNSEGRVTHVGILLNNEHIIHASGKVKIDMIDDEGIYSAELKRHTHKLHSIRRFF
ncbi:C40 family peptidase [Mucilaginibacter sp. FT3.2]|uniref:C40 family peptidase n=1 Tax=Mucilaginibacter sp. FT3.2 TaxID=2723090 RepID=UPI00161B3F5A|nr:C40 family peptidase [Mucilaginibacter sp. FT3.2]MBB6234725.1 hypothetical protein [Mucilaginibacter sp. FT3.2]